MAPIWLPPQYATPVGLIAVELVTNAIKYGLGSMTVRVAQAGQTISVAVTDEGPGFPPAFTPASSRTLGMRLILALARSAGAVSIERTDRGTTVAVQISIPEA